MDAYHNGWQLKHPQDPEASEKALEEEKTKFMEKYEDGGTLDINEVNLLTPVVAGFPFTAENFIKAVEKTFPTRLNGERISLADRTKDKENTKIHFGTSDVEMELTGRVTIENDGLQGLLPGLGNQAPEAPELMPEADADTIASHDYYYKELLKMGAIMDGQIKEKPAIVPSNNMPVSVNSKESERERLERISKGNIIPGDTTEITGIGMYPIPTSYKK